MWNSNFRSRAFYWNTATLIYLHIVHSSFCTTPEELSSYDGDCIAPKSLKYLLSGSLQKNVANLFWGKEDLVSANKSKHVNLQGYIILFLT